MEKDQLERLATILSSGERGYRASYVTEATEVLEIIRVNRPDLYERVVSETKREITRPIETRALAKIKTERQRYHDLGSLENSITLQEGEQTFLFVGQAVDLMLEISNNHIILDSSDDHIIRGFPILTKYALTEVHGWYVQFWPPAIKYGPVSKRKKCWRMKDSNSVFFRRCSINRDYRHTLINYAKHRKGLILESSLLDAVFNPIELKLMERYDQIDNS